MKVKVAVILMFGVFVLGMVAWSLRDVPPSESEPSHARLNLSEVIHQIDIVDYDEYLDAELRISKNGRLVETVPFLKLYSDWLYSSGDVLQFSYLNESSGVEWIFEEWTVPDEYTTPPWEQPEFRVPALSFEKRS